MPRSRTTRAGLIGVLLVSVSFLSGCGGPVFGLVANAVLPEHKKVKVTADYRDLEGKTVAIMVNLNEYAYSQYPGAPKDMAWALSKELRVNVPNITLINPDDLVAYQEANPYWHTKRYSQLINELQVDRIVLIKVLQYSMHEPGNKHILQGMILGEVMVIEAEDAVDALPGSADNLAYAKQIEARYPEDNPIGIVNGDERSVEVATLSSFARRAGQLFYDHQQLRPAR